MTDKRISDFIVSGAMIVRGEHIYIRFSNPFSEQSYLFHIAKSLFCNIIKNRIIEDDIPMFRDKNKEENEKIQKQKNELSELGIYG